MHTKHASYTGLRSKRQRHRTGPKGSTALDGVWRTREDVFCHRQQTKHNDQSYLQHRIVNGLIYDSKIQRQTPAFQCSVNKNAIHVLQYEGVGGDRELGLQITRNSSERGGFLKEIVKLNVTVKHGFSTPIHIKIQ